MATNSGFDMISTRASQIIVGRYDQVSDKATLWLRDKL